MKIIDTTLREGLQNPGLALDFTQKKELLTLLYQCGIREVEAGISSRLNDKTLKPVLHFCRTQLPDLLISLWSRCNIEDIRYGSSLNPDILSLSIPVSDILIKKKMNKSRKWILATPFALAVILFGMLYDHVLRMIITLTSQYFRQIELPEASVLPDQRSHHECQWEICVESLPIC